MDEARQGDGNARTAKVVRQFTPSRIERQLLAQVFDLVSRDQANLTMVSAKRCEHHFSSAPCDRDEAASDSRAMSASREEGRSMTSNIPSTTRVAIYARVSSDQQAQEQTIASQVAALRERVAGDGWRLDDELYFLDDGVSGSTLMRPALERLRDVAYVGGIQKLYVHSPDRLARRYAYQVLLVDELTKHGVEIVFLNRAIGVSPEEDLLLQMQGMFAEYERAKIMERTRRGRRHAAARGSVNVLCGAPYGYRYITRREGEGQAAYEIDEPQAAVVRQVFEWVGRDRLSIGEVTRRLRAQQIKTATDKDWWDRSSVWGMLKNPAYQGLAAFGKTRSGPRRPQLRTPKGPSKTPRCTSLRYDTHASEQLSIPVPAIVSEELFAAVATQLTENRQRGRESRRGATYLLQGLLECACCGYAYYGNKVTRYRTGKKVSYVYYRCTGSDSHRLGGQRVCENKQVRTDKLDEAVWQDVCELLRHPQLLRKEYERRLASPADSATQGSLKKQVAAAQRSVDRLIDAYTAGLLERTEFDPRLTRERSRLSKLKEQLTQLETESREQSALREALACLANFTESIASNLESADWSTRREILRTLIDRVLIEPDQIRIIYRINFPLFAKKASNTGEEQVLHFCWSRARHHLRYTSRLSGTCCAAASHHWSSCFTRTIIASSSNEPGFSVEMLADVCDEVRRTYAIATSSVGK